MKYHNSLCFHKLRNSNLCTFMQRKRTVFKQLSHYKHTDCTNHFETWFENLNYESCFFQFHLFRGPCKFGVSEYIIYIVMGQHRNPFGLKVFSNEVAPVFADGGNRAKDHWLVFVYFCLFFQYLWYLRPCRSGFLSKSGWITQLYLLIYFYLLANRILFKLVNRLKLNLEGNKQFLFVVDPGNVKAVWKGYLLTCPHRITN